MKRPVKLVPKIAGLKSGLGRVFGRLWRDCLQETGGGALTLWLSGGNLRGYV